MHYVKGQAVQLGIYLSPMYISYRFETGLKITHWLLVLFISKSIMMEGGKRGKGERK